MRFLETKDSYMLSIRTLEKFLFSLKIWGLKVIINKTSVKDLLSSSDSEFFIFLYPI
ncbi:MAG: hypothetical protein WCW87_00445 [Candidatus Paceibacterota bacterium]